MLVSPDRYGVVLERGVPIWPLVDGTPRPVVRRREKQTIMRRLNYPLDQRAHLAQPPRQDGTADLATLSGIPFGS